MQPNWGLSWVLFLFCGPSPLVSLERYPPPLVTFRLQCHVMPAHTVLVTGASGGVGGFACLLAKEVGARVIGTCSGDNAEWAEALGADVVIDYETVG